MLLILRFSRIYSTQNMDHSPTQSNEIRGMLEFFVHRVIALEHDIRAIQTEALHQEASRRRMTTNEIIHARIKDPGERIASRMRQEHLLRDLDECGLTRLMHVYADEDTLAKFAHEKAKAERAELRRQKREAEKRTRTKR